MNTASKLDVETDRPIDSTSHANNEEDNRLEVEELPSAIFHSTNQSFSNLASPNQSNYRSAAKRSSHDCSQEKANSDSDQASTVVRKMNSTAEKRASESKPESRPRSRASSRASDKVFEKQNRTKCSDRPGNKDGADNYGRTRPDFLSYSSSKFGLADLTKAGGPLRRFEFGSVENEGDTLKTGRYYSESDADILKLGKEFYDYRNQLLLNPNCKDKPRRSQIEEPSAILGAPGMCSSIPGFQYRPDSRKTEPAFYRVEEPRYSQFKVKAWLQENNCPCKKQGMQRYVKNILEKSVDDFTWKDGGSKECEDKWLRVLREWFRVYPIKCEHRMSSCTLDIEFTVSADSLSQKKLKAYLQNFSKINHVLFDYSIESFY